MSPLLINFFISVAVLALVRLFLICSDEKKEKIIILEVGAAVSGITRCGGVEEAQMYNSVCQQAKF